jgi:hypothetical protein
MLLNATNTTTFFLSYFLIFIYFLYFLIFKITSMMLLNATNTQTHAHAYFFKIIFIRSYYIDTKTRNPWKIMAYWRRLCNSPLRLRAVHIAIQKLNTFST